MIGRSSARRLARRVAPQRMADRARDYERGLRAELGVTALAKRLPPEVCAGPMAGLRYPADRLGEVDAPVAKLLGTYEREIGEAFTAFGGSVFVDVGCADGYYAVGMAVRSAELQTHAFDISSSARDLCGTTAQLNAVADRVHIGQAFDAACLDTIDMRGALFLCDIEGAEAALFTPALVDALHAATVVVEIHESFAPGAALVPGRFAATHALTRFDPQAPDLTPALSRGWSPEDARLALHERRGDARTWWAVLAPRALPRR